jgi:hypothetical protein
MTELTRELRARIEALLHDSVVSAVTVAGGYTPAARWLITLRSRDKVFVKVGTTAYTTEALRLEWQAYSALKANFMPRFIAWDDHPTEPMLVLEDLSAGFWPPPWQLPRLIDANARVELTGSDVVHFDVRSDNICRVPRGIVFVDWNCACLGNGALDTGFWLPSLQAEGGPAPEETLPDRPDIAALVSGFFACRAGLPTIPHAPRVRAVQLQQLVPALHWAARALELPPPNQQPSPAKL